MIKNITCIALFLMAFSMSFAQKNLNEYKYVVVPTKFDFQKNENQYNLNSLVKFLLNKEGFKTLMANESMPEDLIKNGCLALKANVLNKSLLFKTQMKIQLRNCKDEVIYTSTQGVSREKAYKKAYHEAVRMAFESFKTVNYKYVPNNNLVSTSNETVNAASKVEIAKLKKEIKTLKNQEATGAKNSIKKGNKSEVKDVKISPAASNKIESTTPETILYAQTIKNGFQLVDRTPKVVYTMYDSGIKDIYIVKAIDAIIYKLNNQWVIAEITNEVATARTLTIKF